MNNENKLAEILKTIIDPELMVNVVDLGLVYKSEIDDELKKIDIDLTLTSRGCPLGDMIIENAKRSIQNVFENYNVNVNLVWEPAWTTDRMSEQAKSDLGNK